MLQFELGLFKNEELSSYTNQMLNSFNNVLIVDRTLDDVERWRSLRDKGWDKMSTSEREEWLGKITARPTATRGMYTHEDLNRIETAIELLSLRLNRLGHLNTTVEVKRDWTYKDNIWREDMERILDNIGLLRGSINVYPTTPEAPTIDHKFDYKMVNDIEQILVDLDDIISKYIQSQRYVGETYSGEV